MKKGRQEYGVVGFTQRKLYQNLRVDAKNQMSYN